MLVLWWVLISLSPKFANNVNTIEKGNPFFKIYFILELNWFHTYTSTQISKVELPSPETPFPREKMLPKAKRETKWEKYAKEKGIKKRKRDNLVWDAEKKDWAPRFGYKVCFSSF